MTPEQKDQYIALLEDFKNVIVKNNKGWHLDELAALRAIEEFENTLPCNQEFADFYGNSRPADGKHNIEVARDTLFSILAERKKSDAKKS